MIQRMTIEGSCWVPAVCCVVHGSVEVMCVGEPLVIVNPLLVGVGRERPVEGVGRSEVVGFL